MACLFKSFCSALMDEKEAVGPDNPSVAQSTHRRSPAVPLEKLPTPALPETKELSLPDQTNWPLMKKYK